MGYTTEFEGKFYFDKPLDTETYQFLKALSETRRMKRNVGPEYGEEGEFYVHGKGMMGQDDEENIVDHNSPPWTQPGLWCQWTPSPCGLYLEWDGSEKFYHYVEWLHYIANKILKPRGYALTGKVNWQGEDSSDKGTITAVKSEIRTTTR